jgi:predicted nucleotidyltransferase
MKRTVATSFPACRLIGARRVGDTRRANARDLPIDLDARAIAAFCRARGIRKLSVFGSVLREDFDPGRSDVEVLVEFNPDAHPGLKFFGYGDELADIIGRKVDLNTPAWLSKYFREEVLREAVPIYEQA